jgi:hypothetical protein
LLVSAALLPAGIAQAGSVRPAFKDVLRTMSSSVPVPPEWSGIWDVTDSTYDCSGVLTGTSSDPETLCTGQSVQPPSTGSPVTIDCTGTATATELHMVCTGSAAIMPDCQLDLVMHIDIVRTADTYFSILTMTTSYSGTAEGCDLLPGNCMQINSHGIRTGAAPADFCAGVPTRPASWGQVKAHYR